MLSIVLAIRCLLCLIFLVAAVGKFADLPGSRRAVRGFGMPESLADSIGTALPAVELAIGLALLFARTAWWGAVGAAALLTCFVLAIGANLLRGKTPDCHCFGQLHSAPAGPKTLIRNLVLVALAILLVARGAKNTGAGIGDILGGLTGAHLAWLVTAFAVVGSCAVATWFMLQLYKQNGRLLQRIEALEQRGNRDATHPTTAEAPTEPPHVGLPLGSPAPAFELLDTGGRPHSLQSLLRDSKPLMLLFIDPECGPCKAMLPGVAVWHTEYAEIMKIAIVSRGAAKKNLEKLDSQALPSVLLQQDREVATAYQCYGTPGAVWIGADGRITSYVGQGSVEIEKMFGEQRKRATPELRPAHNTGDPAPEFFLPSLSGRHTKLADFRGQPLVLLFWNPSCGFCMRMLEDLRFWERTPPSNAPQLLVISTGPAEANRKMGLRSEIVLDDDFLVGRAFKSTGTPSAILLDEHGVVSTPLATGEDAVRSLLGFEDLAGAASGSLHRSS
ncbi:MAG: doxX [Edaphobacter sp.]|nr:doxX [Edaphobacter sp.]